MFRLPLYLILLSTWIDLFAEGKSVPLPEPFRQGNLAESLFESSWRLNSPVSSPTNSLTYRSSRTFSSSRKRDANFWNYNSNIRTSDCKHMCDDGACLPRAEYRCDLYAHCWDGSDEKSCSCDSIMDQDKICDGVPDCPHHEDEKDCVYGCLPSELPCDQHNTGQKVKCFSKTKECDGYFDCPNGKDEERCFRTVDLVEETRGLRSSGILQKQMGGLWYTVCKTPSSSNHIPTFSKKVCDYTVGTTEEAPKVTAVSLTSLKAKMTQQQMQELRYIRLSDKELKFSILAACASDRVYEVNCPHPKCGGQGNYAQNQRRKRQVDDDDELNNSLEDEEDEDSDIEMIVGGHATEDNQWPFLVAIIKDGTFYCGGSIINKRWILTAAHCCHKYDQHVYEVQAGMTRISSYSPYEQTRGVEEIHVHEDYDSKIFANDIALYKLDKPLHLSKYVTEACLPNGYDDDPTHDQKCKVAGWGDLKENGEGPDHMQEVELPVLEKCQETFTNDSRQICAGVMQGGKDACQGDSGGPLLCMKYGVPTVSGIVSFGRGCARKYEAGAYTRVSAYKDWINRVISNETPRPPSFSRPKQCTEKCYKSVGECVFEEEKCSGSVECSDASDERRCAHAVTRDAAGGDFYYGQSSQVKPYWTNYPLINYQRAGSSRKTGFSDVSTVPYQPTSISQMFPPPSFQRALNDESELIEECSEDKFQCALATGSNDEGCIFTNMVCDRIVHCLDGTDENDCFGISGNLNEPLDVSKTRKGEAKGYAIVRYQGLEWHPLILDEWTLESGFAMCDNIFPGGNLESLEVMKVDKLAERLKTFSLMESTIVKSNSVNGFLSQENVSGGTSSEEVTKIGLSQSEIAIDTKNLLLGFIRCKRDL